MALKDLHEFVENTQNIICFVMFSGNSFMATSQLENELNDAEWIKWQCEQFLRAFEDNLKSHVSRNERVVSETSYLVP